MEIKIDAKPLTDAIKRAWNENPIAVITAGAVLTGALAKVIDSVSSARSRRAYARQVDYRVKRRR